MKLTDIISISGKPGLFELINKTRSPFTVRDLSTGKKLPIFPRDSIVSLADISIYTIEDDMPLGQVFEKVKEKYPNGIEVDGDMMSNSSRLHQLMEECLPIYDNERVRDGDIKKIIKWYNILREAGMELFFEEPEEEQPNEEE